MFSPIVAQKFEDSGKMKSDPKWFTEEAAAETERMLFDVTKNRAWRTNATLKKASIDNSPLALAFSRCKKRAADADACIRQEEKDAKKKK